MQAKSILIGFIICMILVDELRVHQQIQELTQKNTKLQQQESEEQKELSDATQIAQHSVRTSDSCLTTLNECRLMQASAVEMHKLETMTRIQMMDLVKSAEGGDQEALEKMRELGSMVKNGKVKAMDPE